MTKKDGDPASPFEPVNKVLLATQIILTAFGRGCNDGNPFLLINQRALDKTNQLVAIGIRLASYPFPNMPNVSESRSTYQPKFEPPSAESRWLPDDPHDREVVLAVYEQIPDVAGASFDEIKAAVKAALSKLPPPPEEVPATEEEARYIKAGKVIQEALFGDTLTRIARGLKTGESLRVLNHNAEQANIILSEQLKRMDIDAEDIGALVPRVLSVETQGLSRLVLTQAQWPSAEQDFRDAIETLRDFAEGLADGHFIPLGSLVNLISRFRRRSKNGNLPEDVEASNRLGDFYVKLLTQLNDLESAMRRCEQALRRWNDRGSSYI